ncbi:IPT/TIG domain-containing protein [Tindallia californiensis]|uniref:IPT/TIG domain-containing protein n=1 Tax=Tindallia californiensis TaxID=159292 RepID=A0A1H3PFA3_9FIRM|nr:IPT/TIG domain-containing protein [Tindallia californiensis]SDY99728.1 IPT/TIG domain-containing protein [Tindallia californiensis]
MTINRHQNQFRKRFFHKKRIQPRRAIAGLLLVAFFVSILPVAPNQGFGILSAWASDLERPTVTIRTDLADFDQTGKTISVNEPESVGSVNRSIEVEDTSEGVYTIPAGDLSYGLGATTQGNLPEDFKNIESVTLIFYQELADGTLERDIKIYENIRENMPRITNIIKPIVSDDEMIVINSDKTDITNLAEDNFIVNVGSTEARVITNDDSPEGDGLSDKQIGLVPKEGSFTGGVNDIIVQRETEKETTTNSLRNVDTYRNAVTIITDLELDGIEMFPTMGRVGSQVEFTRGNMSPNGYDVYFVENLTNINLFNEEAKAKPVSLPVEVDDQWVYTVEVPNVRAGRDYFVVLTPPGRLDTRYVMDSQFRVIEIEDSPILEGFDPTSAPTRRPTEVELWGSYWTRLAVPGLEDYVLAGDSDFDPATAIRFEIGGDLYDHIPEGESVETLVIQYEGSGDFRFSDDGDDYPILSVERRFRVYMGQDLSIHEFTHNSSQDGFEDGQGADNSLKVRTRDFSDDQAGPVPVELEVETMIRIEDLGSPSGERVLSLRENLLAPGDFTYIPSTEQPDVTDIVPTIFPLQTEPTGGVGHINDRIGPLQVVIRGENFLVTRYEDADGQDRIAQPRVELGSTIIDPGLEPGEIEGNRYGPTKFEVLQGGTLVDGKGANQIGDTIVMTLETGTSGFPVTNTTNRDIRISNPRRESDDYAVFRRFENMVDFTYVDPNQYPRITNVEPNLVAMEGGVPVRIDGSQLRSDARLYIGGEEVTAITDRSLEHIEFIAPPGNRPGETQLQVINPEGGIATHPFTYTETDTNPALTSVTPDRGTENTLLTLTGSDFFRPDPTIVVNNIDDIDAFIMNRLMGSRVEIGGRDINRYNRDGTRIALTPFNAINRTVEESVFVYQEETDRWRTGDGFDSVIFIKYPMDPDAPVHFFRLVRNRQNQYYLEDGAANSWRIRYNKEEDQFEGVEEGGNVVIQQLQNGVLEIDGMTLRAYTPYTVERVGSYDRITGNRVQVLGSNEIHARVPNMMGADWAGPGTYDVSVVNPDTQKATLQNAFTYLGEPKNIPALRDIVPELGPDSGGNLVTLKLDEAVTDASFTEGIRIFIGSQEVPRANINLSVDSREIVLTVPPYAGNLQQEGQREITLPLTLLNSDGGTFSVDYDNPITVERVQRDADGNEQTIQKELLGYTYVVPTSNPEIERIVPTAGSAAGGYTVEIFGVDFRDFRRIRDEDGNLIETITANPDITRPSRYDSEFDVLLDDLYPRVFFGTEEAELVEFDGEFLRVIVGPNEGTVPVYIVNNDAGISNTVNFSFESSDPQITSVNPPQGDRRGGTSVEIRGQALEEDLVTLMTKEYEENSPLVSVREEDTRLTRVRVGNRTNADLPREHENSGVIQVNRTRVTLEDGLRFDYNSGDGGVLNVQITDQGNTYRHEYLGFGAGEEVFINTRDLSREEDGETIQYPYEELVRLEIRNRRLFVEGGYAPEVAHRNQGHIVATMPSYFTTGRVRLSVINPDGGTANSDFEYITPDSNPVITNILREGREPVRETREGYGEVMLQKVSQRGGNIIRIVGTDFREDATIRVGDILTLGPDHPNRLEDELPNQLVFELPELPENTINNLYRIVVTNFDGGSANSEEALYQGEEAIAIYLEVTRGESNPRLDTVTPNKGPVTGGTRLTIRGNDFRQEMDGYSDPIGVLFGEARVDEDSGDVEYVDYRQLEVVAPESPRYGNVRVRVENPDGELSLPPGEFQYISQPNIESVDPPRIFANDMDTEITLTGEMFMNGAQVILGGRLVPINEVTDDMEVHGEGIRGVDEEGRNREFAVVGGVAANTVNVESENVMRVQFPETLDLEHDDLIILNPDEGLSDPDDAPDFDYDIPVPDAPLVVEAVPGSEGSIHLIWSKSDPGVLNAAASYEVYGKRSAEREYTFIAEANDADYLVRNLEPDTRYDFRVRALNEYGSAIESGETSARTLHPDEDPKLEEKLEELDRQREELETQGREEIINGTVVRTIGSREIPDGRAPYRIDFSGAEHSRYNDFIVAFPVQSLASMNREVVITDGKASLTIAPNTLYTRDVSNLSAEESRDGVARIHFTRLEGNEANALNSAIDRRQSRASNPYHIDFSLKAGRAEKNLPRILGSGQISIDLDTGRYPESNSGNTGISTYHPSAHSFQRNNGRTMTIREAGKYMLLRDR